jgi:predicted MFS family arabinose efflux permease
MAFNYRRYHRDFALLFVTRIMRMIAYGMLAVIFLQHLFEKGLSELEASTIQSGIVVGDIVISLYLTTRADKLGRINTLMVGSLLKLVTGLIYADSNDSFVLLVAGVFGVISVTGAEIGPFMPIEQSALAQLVEKSCDHSDEVPKSISRVFGYYNMVGYLSQAGGSAFAGYFMKWTYSNCASQAAGMTNLLRIYAALGGLCFLCYFAMSVDHIEPDHAEVKKAVNCAGIEDKHTPTIGMLFLLFGADAGAGAFIAQSFLSYYYQKKYNQDFDQIGTYLFFCNILSGISGILSSKLVDSIGAVATMVYTHLPSNILLLLIAFTDNSTLSLVFLFARFCISQMDVPARQTFVTLIVSPNERSAANGITSIGRSVGLAIGLYFNGFFMGMDPDIIGFSVPFLIAGGVKIMYDLVLGFIFLWKKEKKEEVRYEVASMEMTENVSEPEL